MSYSLKDFATQCLWLELPVSASAVAASLNYYPPISLRQVMSTYVTPPSGGLGSNSNYFLASDGNPVTDLSVIIDITEDMVADFGLSFQLNGWSPPGANCVWQQYCFLFDTSDPAPRLQYMIGNWPAPGFDNTKPNKDLIRYSKTLLTLPVPSPTQSGATLPTGCQLTIRLKNDSAGNIIGVTFLFVDNDGNPTSSQLIRLTSLSVDGIPSEPITQAALAPISAFQLNLVGEHNSQYTYLATGAGTITYVATSPLTVLTKRPSYAPYSGDTAEEANSAYYGLPAGPCARFTQRFRASQTTPDYKAGGRFAVSQQFGAEQTNLYAVDRAGQLDVFSVQGSGNWSRITGLGPVGLAHPGAAVAASEDFYAIDRTNVFLVDQLGQLNVFGVDSQGNWSGPDKMVAQTNSCSGANLAVSQQLGVANQTDVFLVDKNGQLNVFSFLIPPIPIGPAGLAVPGAAVAVSQQFGAPDQTDVFLVDTNGTLNMFFVQGPGNWSTQPTLIGPAGIFPEKAYVAASQQFGAPDQTDVFVVDNNGQLNMFWVQSTGNWSAQPTLIGPKGLALAGAPTAVSQRFGVPDETDVFVVDKHGTLNMFSVQGTGSWSTQPVLIGPPGIAPSASQSSKGAFVAVSLQFGLANQTDVFVLNVAGQRDTQS